MLVLEAYKNISDTILVRKAISDTISFRKIKQKHNNIDNNNISKVLMLKTHYIQTQNKNTKLS